MKTNLYVVCALVLSCWVPATRSSDANCSDDARTIAQKKVDALRGNNARFLSDVVDPAGIVIGVDEPPMSASQFRNELAKKNGVFCVLFDDQACAGRGYVKSPVSSSLHQLVRKKVVIKTTAQGMREGSQIVSAVVSRSRNPKEILFTFYFRCIAGHWVLANIDYE